MAKDHLDLFPIGETPVFMKRNERIPRTVRVRPRERKLKDMKMSRLNTRQRRALQLYHEKGGKLEKKKEAAMEAGYAESSAVPAMNRLLERKPIVKALKKKGVTDDKIAETIAEGFDSRSPSNPAYKDPHAVHKFVQEANKILDNYPPKEVHVKKQSQTMVVHFTAENVKQFEKYQRMRGERVRD